MTFQNCSFWVPVDEIGEENSIEFVKASHRSGKWHIPRKFESNKNYERKSNSLGEGHQNKREYSEVPDVDNMNGVDKLKWSCKVSYVTV